MCTVLPEGQWDRTQMGHLHEGQGTSWEWQGDPMGMRTAIPCCIANANECLPRRRCSITLYRARVGKSACNASYPNRHKVVQPDTRQEWKEVVKEAQGVSSLWDVANSLVLFFYNRLAHEVAIVDSSWYIWSSLCILKYSALQSNHKPLRDESIPG